MPNKLGLGLSEITRLYIGQIARLRSEIKRVFPVPYIEKPFSIRSTYRLIIYIY